MRPQAVLMTMLWALVAVAVAWRTDALGSIVFGD